MSKGIAKRYFKKRMQISDHLEVEKAKFEDGMLLISLKNVRESKAKEIKIS